MAYPWPSFSSFIWQDDERALDGIGGIWRRKPSVERVRPLGSAKDSIILMAAGSMERQFDCYLSPARYLQLEALCNTSSTFTDWDNPPQSRNAYLENIEPGPFVAFQCSDGTTTRRILTTVFLVSQ